MKKAPKKAPKPVVRDLFEEFERALLVRPHLLLEIGFNRVTDWMVHIYDATGVGIKAAVMIIETHHCDREDAMRLAAKQLATMWL